MPREETRRTGRSGLSAPAAEPLEPEEAARKAEAYALDVLALRPRTVLELRTRLAGKGYARQIIDDLVERCLRIGYLNDRAFAEYWVEERCQSYPCGPARLRLELRQKGVDAQMITSVLTAVLSPEREGELAVRLAKKKAVSLRAVPDRAAPDRAAPDLATPDRASTEKLWNFLRRRGFGTRACQEALRSVCGPSEELSEVETAGPDEADSGS
jgi:regulatory protein